MGQRKVIRTLRWNNRKKEWRAGKVTSVYYDDMRAVLYTGHKNGTILVWTVVAL